MNFDKRIWKTGVMAAAITMVAALFVMRLDDWSKGLTSGFIAYGQSGSGGTGSTGGTGTGTITKTLPHLVGGGGYSSVIEAINTSNATESVTASFFDQKGNASSAGYTASLNGAAPATFTGAMPAVSLPVNGTLVITLPNTGDTIVNWGNLVSTSTITVAEVFELRDPNSALISRVGVPASAPNMTSFIIPRFRNISTRMDVGFAIANTGSTDTNVTVTMRDASGNTLQTTVLPLPKHQQIAAFPSDIFPGLTAPPDATGYGSLTFSAPNGQAQLAAVGLAIENRTNSLATFPVDQLQ